MAKKCNARLCEAHDAGRWLGLAAAPTFALMAWLSATDAAHTVMHASAPGGLAIGGMAWMYLLMTLFHASPWLRLVCGRPRPFTRPTLQPEGD